MSTVNQMESTSNVKDNLAIDKNNGDIIIYMDL